MVICLEQGADLHMAQPMPLPLTVSCSSKIQIGFTFLVPAHLGTPGQRAVKRVCVCLTFHSILLQCFLNIAVLPSGMAFSMYTVIHNYGNPYKSGISLLLGHTCGYNLAWLSPR